MKVKGLSVGEDSLSNADFDEIYYKNVNSVYKTALYYSRDKCAAEDITQKVFLKLYMNKENINLDAVSSWLTTTTRRMALNYKRDQWHEIPTEEIYNNIEDDFYVESPEEDIMDIFRGKEYRELTERIFDDLYETNERWYYAVTITYLLEKPQKEVAEVMGMELESLHSMLYRAKRWIQKRYKEEYDRLKNI